MARLDISNIEWNGILRGNLLEEFKQYASIPDGSRDAMLLSILKNAILKVQEYGDRALIPCTVTQVCRVPPTGYPIRKAGISSRLTPFRAES